MGIINNYIYGNIQRLLNPKILSLKDYLKVLPSIFIFFLSAMVFAFLCFKFFKLPFYILQNKLDSKMDCLRKEIEEIVYVNKYREIDRKLGFEKIKKNNRTLTDVRKIFIIRLFVGIFIYAPILIILLAPIVSTSLAINSVKVILIVFIWGVSFSNI